EGLSLFRSPRRPRNLKREEVALEEPTLEQEGLTGAPLYYDCSTDDARLTLENAIDAARQGAVVVTRAKVVSFVKDEASRVVGVVVEDQESGGLKEIRAGAIVNATGPWTDRTVSMSRPLTSGPLLRPTKGIHIVVPHERLAVNHAVVCFHPRDGRVLFAIPWSDHTYIGTTDTDYDGDPALVAATSEDVDYLLDAANGYFPECSLVRSDVVSTWAGLRPLMRPTGPGGGIDESAVSREHQILVGQDGLITIAGGKLTTYRRMAAEVVDTATKLLRLSNRLPSPLTAAHTDQEPLPGAVGWPADDDHDKVAAQVHEVGDGAIGLDTARLLANTYGMRALDIARLAADDRSLAARLVPTRPEILAQVDWAVRQELASEVADIMVRRTQVFYRDQDQGLGAVPVVSARMAALLGWSEERRRESAAAYEAEVAMSRAWRS
ncbi:MAG: glycerol-3-phosphate dehydrogenase, partial [Myxococcota bacterium]